MAAKKNLGVSIICGICGRPFHPWGGRETTTRFCSRQCNGAHNQRTKERSLEHFWARVEKTDACWLWTGATNQQGYGVFNIGSGVERAHRIAYRLITGPIPHGLFLCHRCDTPACVNPDHLFPGSQADNMHDCHTKGRYSRKPTLYGTHHHLAKLTPALVRQIRVAEGTGKEVGARFGVSASAVRAVKHRQTWKHVT